MKFSRLLSLPLLALAPLALAACGETEGVDGVTSGEPRAAIAAPDGTSWTETVAVTPEGGYVVGNPDAPLKLVEFASHTCGACANFSVTGKPTLKEKYIASGVVSFEQREIFLNSYDLVLAGLVQCGAKEQMQPLSDEVWANLNQVLTALQSNPEAMQAADQLPLDQKFARIAEVGGLLEFFAARGLSAYQGRACLSDQAKIENLVKTVETQAKENNITATPTFLLNGKRLDVTQWAQLEPLLQRAGAR
jgi:protein-disulfide isomerase